MEEGICIKDKQYQLFKGKTIFNEADRLDCNIIKGVMDLV